MNQTIIRLLNEVASLREENDDLKKQVEFWQNGYEKEAKTVDELKTIVEELRNAYVDDIGDIIRQLIRLELKMSDKEEYKPKHAKKEN